MTLEIWISLIALIVSVVTLIRSRSYNQQQLDLQRVVSNLAQKQLDLLNAEESERTDVGHTNLHIEIVPHGNAHKFVVSNIGEYAARDIEFELEPQGRGANPLIRRDYDEKFPIPILQPGNSVGVLAGFHMGSATAFMVKLKWKEENNEPWEVETYISL